MSLAKNVIDTYEVFKRTLDRIAIENRVLSFSSRHKFDKEDVVQYSQDYIDSVENTLKSIKTLKREIKNLENKIK